VRAWEEVFHLLAEACFSFPVIFHGFNKGPAIARRIVGKGYYLSIGQWIERERIRAVLQDVPLAHLFLETDAVSVSIAHIYALAAAAYDMPLHSFVLQIMNNGRRVFGEKFIEL
jgi:TatD DNase family protein